MRKEYRNRRVTAWAWAEPPFDVRYDLSVGTSFECFDFIGRK